MTDVTQADREAAAKIFDHYAPNYAALARANSPHIDNLVVTQTLANHRAQADAPDDVAKNADYNLGFDDGMAIGKHEAEHALSQPSERDAVVEAVLEVCAIIAENRIPDGANEDEQAAARKHAQSIAGIFRRNGLALNDRIETALRQLKDAGRGK